MDEGFYAVDEVNEETYAVHTLVVSTVDELLSRRSFYSNYFDEVIYAWSAGKMRT